MGFIFLLIFLLKGLLIGFAIAAPVGPIGVLCIRRTLSDGWKSGVLTGLGAATADGVYGCVAGFGLTLVTEALIKYRVVLQLIGGLFILYLGLKNLLSTPTIQTAEKSPRHFYKMYWTTFLLTLTNPMTILSFAAIFSGVGIINAKTSYASALCLIAGVFLGSAIWWLLLAGGVEIFRQRLGQPRQPLSVKNLAYINRLAGLILLIMGGLIIFRLGSHAG